MWVVCVPVGRHYNGPQRASPPPWSGSDSTPAPRPARAHHLQFGPQRQSIWVHSLEGPASPIFSGKQWFMVVLCKLASCITVSHRNSGSKTMQRVALTTDVLQLTALLVKAPPVLTAPCPPFLHTTNSNNTANTKSAATCEP